MSLLLLSSDLHVGHHAVGFHKFLAGAKKYGQVNIIYFPHLMLLRRFSLGHSKKFLFDPLVFASIDFKTFANIVNAETANNVASKFAYLGIINQGISLITEKDFLNAQSRIFGIPIQECENYSYASIPLGQIARRDISLICQSNRPPSTFSKHQEGIYRVSIFLAQLAIGCVQTFYRAHQFGKIETGTFLVPDRYSAYISAANYSRSLGKKVGVLHFDHVFKDHQRITDLEFGCAETIALYNLQFAGGEYALPSVMFDYAKQYISKKILNQQSNQVFSPAVSDPALEHKVGNYIGNYEKNICYFTSSPDELLSPDFNYDSTLTRSGYLSKGYQLYSQESDFLHDTLSYAIEHNIGVLIRIHPRMKPSVGPTGSVIPSGLADLYEVLAKFPEGRFLVVHPGEQLCSYLLASYGSLNLYFWSTIGIELLMLGHQALSPNARNSYTYYGYQFMHGDHPSSKEEFFLNLEDVLARDSVCDLDLLFSAVRAFYIENTASHFVLNELLSVGFGPYLLSLYFRRGFFPWFRLKKLSTFSRQLRVGVRSQEFKNYVSSASSIRYPHYIGYWNLADYEKPASEYRDWLTNNFNAI